MAVLSKKDAFDYDVTVKGLFGRNRKIKVETFKLCRHDTKQDPGTIIALARIALAAHKVKPGAAFYVSEQPMCVEDHGQGLQVVSFMCFSDTKLAAGHIAPGGEVIIDSHKP